MGEGRRGWGSRGETAAGHGHHSTLANTYTAFASSVSRCWLVATESDTEETEDVEAAGIFCRDITGLGHEYNNQPREFSWFQVQVSGCLLRQ
ncbi:hypothetical protein BaRGS_00020333 [Batillaria attramentaria]|uniref:Uncharacterized protein n=1 Tax=Batillaria attramentaria TaxID=370345 RepID=A0ABD0KMK8_9CAEN